MLQKPKKKFYPLVGEAEMADELNKIERSRPPGYRTSGQAPMPAPKNKPTRGRAGTAIRVSSNPFNNKKSGRDYPLSESPNPTFKNQMVAPIKKQTNKFPKGIVKEMVSEGINEAISTYKNKK